MRTEALEFPKSILIETATSCQGQCLFCPYSKIRRGEKQVKLSKNKFVALISEISKYDVKRLTLFNNNEPLLDDRIYHFIEYAHDKLPNIEITLSTNGRLVTLDVLNKLYNSGLTTFYISIPTVDEEAYKQIMGVKPDKLFHILSSIDNENLINMIRIAIPQTKFTDFEKMKKLLYQYKLCMWPIEYKENWNIDDEIMKVTSLEEYIGPCDRPLDQAVISANGNVIICCRDWREQNVLGNVYEDSLYDIWHNPTSKRIQHLIAKQQYDDIECCKDCTSNHNYYLKKVKKL